MRLKNFISIFFVLLIFSFAIPSQAETIKRGLIGCVSEELLDELLTYIRKSDQGGMMQLMRSGQCMMLKVGEPVSVISPGFMTATIRYKGVKLYTPSEAIR